MQHTIPVLNFRRHHQDQFSKELGEALRDVGFCSIINHEINPELIKSAYSVVERFFNLPEHVKRKYEIEGLKGQRGFTSFGRETAIDSELFDLKEFFHVGAIDVCLDLREQYNYPDNIWPDEIIEFKYIMTEFYNQMRYVGVNLMCALARYLGEDQYKFTDMANNGNTILRAIHYPPVLEKTSNIRAAAHEDINLITLLCESSAPGLELLQTDGSWLPIHRLDGQIIVNSSDMLHNISNGIFRSTTHRVVNPDPTDISPRFSMPYFVHPTSDTNLSPLQSCIDKVGYKRTRSILAGDFLQERLTGLGL